MNVAKARHLTEKLKCQNNKEMNFDLIQDLKKQVRNLHIDHCIKYAKMNNVHTHDEKCMLEENLPEVRNSHVFIYNYILIIIDIIFIFPNFYQKPIVF